MVSARVRRCANGCACVHGGLVGWCGVCGCKCRSVRDHLCACCGTAKQWPLELGDLLIGDRVEVEEQGRVRSATVKALLADTRGWGRPGVGLSDGSDAYLVDIRRVIWVDAA
jgi:hypothetical protein